MLWHFFSSLFFHSEILKANWDGNKALKVNMTEMGLAFDANHVVKIPSTKQQFIERAKGKVTFNNGDVKLISEAEREEKQRTKNEETKNGKDTEVIRALELEANNEDGRRKTFRFSKEDVRFITYMMERHGDDFKVKHLKKKTTKKNFSESGCR